MADVMDMSSIGATLLYMTDSGHDSSRKVAPGAAVATLLLLPRAGLRTYPAPRRAIVRNALESGSPRRG